jgi:hypothetical protein
MQDTSPRHLSRVSAVWDRLARHSLPLEHETALFVLASALDVVMTYYLLNHPEIQFVESNPIARYFIYSWGIKGMVGFKFTLVAFVSIICQIIARTKPDVARRVLQFSTAVVGGVVIYSVLLMRHGQYWI